MARAPRLAVAGELHYVVQRGHNDQQVFVDFDDRKAYLTMLRDAAIQNRVAIHAYALLNSEVHLLATPTADSSLGRLMQSLGRRYVASFNRRHGRKGTLWSGRFRAGLVDGTTLGAEALVHVESLPLRTEHGALAPDWPWSSAAHHLGRLRDPLVTEHPAYWALGNTPFERELVHADKLRAGLPVELHEAFDRTALQGRVIGSASFKSRIAQKRGLHLEPRPRGRPAKPRQAT